METGHKLQTLVQDAICRLREGRIDEAISLFSKARKDIIKQISSESMTSDMYDLLVNLSALTYLGMLNYFAIGQKTSEKTDSIAKLTYFSESLGFSNVLDGVLVPLLTINDSIAKKKGFLLLRQVEESREELHRKIAQLISSIQNGKGERQKQYNESIKQIIDAVNPGSVQVRTLALQLGRRFEAGNFKQARKIYEYVRDEIHYMRDPLPFEDIQSPEITLERATGDCDDQAILLCSLLLAIGFETALFFADTDNDGMADHVYSAVHIPDAPDLYKPFADKKIAGKGLHDWIPLDPTSEDLDFGVITFANLEIKHAFFFAAEGQYFLDEKK
jgi:hypothetical protein